MPGQILSFLLDTVLGLFSLALLLRFYMQLLRTPYGNPLSRFLIAVTDFIVRPARKIIPGLYGMDLATLLLAWLVQCLLLTGLHLLQNLPGTTMPLPLASIGLLALTELVKTSLHIVMAAIIIQAILSWVNPHSPVAPALSSFTEPFLGIVRKRIPPIAHIDLSPLVVLVVIQILLMVVTGLQHQLSILS